VFPACAREFAGEYAANQAKYLKPRGVPMTSLESVGLSVDEFEAIRLKRAVSYYSSQE
jgi:predicted DNA-binding protein (UPF0251 family)